MTDEVQKEITRALSSALGSSAAALGELLADKIRYLRWKSAVRTLEKARAFAEGRGGLARQPPLKFFLPFMENCSLEEDDEDVVDMWANLLVSAAFDFQPGHLLFMRILREITGSEARLLRDIAHAGGHHPVHQSALDDAVSSWEMFAAPASPLHKIDITDSWENTKRFVFQNLQLPGIMIEHLGLYDHAEKPKAELQSIYTKDTILADHSRISLDILVSLNLVEKVEQSFWQQDQRYELDAVAFCMTAMGAAFYGACAGNDVVRGET